MTLVFKKGEFGSPARRRRRFWPATTTLESSCVAGRDEDSFELQREREGELLVLVREMFEANEV